MAQGDRSVSARRAESGAAASTSKADFGVGSRCLCQASFDNNAQRPAEIIERKVASDGSVSYYVHYMDFDKRLDEWVSQDRLVQLNGCTQMDVLTPRMASLPILPQGHEVALGDNQKVTRQKKRRYNEINHVTSDMAELPPIDQHLEKEHQEKTKVKNIQCVEMGKSEMDTWYYSPYPEPYASLEKLHVCEFCLKYFGKEKTLIRHMAKCEMRHPPGDEIYRSPPEPKSPGYCKTPIAVFEVCGRSNKVYCQSLCLLSKLFLDHKTLYYDVDPFLFYVLTEKDSDGYHIVGYFSKDKESRDNYNLACILTLPPYQRKGYGSFLIDFSYALSKKEGNFMGTPERPLSDLGNVSYRSYWLRKALEVLYENRSNLSLKDINVQTAIRVEDLSSTLQSLNLIKYWKGDHLLCVTQKVVEDHLAALEGRKFIKIVEDRLRWQPPNTKDTRR
ncbi:g8161 [Coccomyxa viridis]|uniref:histone acetyltransferase n=1 Tax=Coccomyxa viridis TaxID=1274662 RepID=A0ABP1G4J2_9CHLO